MLVGKIKSILWPSSTCWWTLLSYYYVNMFVPTFVSMANIN